MNRLFLCAVCALSLLMTSPSNAATIEQERSFVFSFTVVNVAQNQILSFDPFVGSASTLTGVTLEFASQVAGTNISAGDWSVGVFLNNALIDISLFPIPLQNYSFTANLLGLGFTPTDFTGASVDLQLRAFADEGSFTGVWHAGVGVPILGLDPFGGVRLTYTYDDQGVIPLPASLWLFVSGFAALSLLRRRVG